MTDADTTTLSAPACRAARALIGWSLDDLADAVGLSRDSISRFESGTASTMRASNQRKVIAAFRAHGVEVFGEPAPGARLHRA